MSRCSETESGGVQCELEAGHTGKCACPEALNRFNSKCRGTGRTTRQLQWMKSGGAFIWCNSNTQYVHALARSLGRGDIKIYPRSILSRADKLRGLEFPQVVLDHALERTTESERMGIDQLRNLVR